MIKRDTLFIVSFVVVWLWLTFNSLYVIFTGDALWTNIHYNTGGRILNAVAVVVFTGITIYMIKAFKDLEG